MIPNAEFLKGAAANSNSGALTEMVVIPVDLPWPCNITETRAIAAARASPDCHLKKPVNVVVSQRQELGQFVDRLTIKAYVVDVRLDRVMTRDITKRTLKALAVRHMALTPEMGCAE